MKILAIGDFHGKFPEKLRKIARRKDIDLVVSVGDYGGIKEWYKYLMYIFKKFDEGASKESIKSSKEFFGKKKYKKLIKKDEKVAKKVLSSLNKLGKRVIFIFGNTDDGWYKYPFDKQGWNVKKSNLNFVRKLKNLRNITYSKINYKDIVFIGFGGYMDVDEYLKERVKTKEDKERISGVKERREKSKKKLFDNLKETKGKRIFVFHYPPNKIFDTIKDKKNPRHGTSAGINFFRQAIMKYKPLLVLCGHMHENQGKKKIGKTLVVNTGAACEGKAAVIEFDEKKGKVERVRFLK